MDTKIKKQIYFLFILLLIVLLGYFLVNLFLSANVILKTIIGIIAIIIIISAIVVKFGGILFLNEYERAVILRFGRLDRIGGPGWTLIIPGIEKALPVELRTQTIDIPKQDVITKDNVMVTIDAVVYMRVNKDPKDIVNAVISVENYREAARLFIKAQIRDVIGTMTLSETVSNINDLNEKLKKELQQVSKDWGIKVDSAEIKEIKIPDEVIDAMHKQKAAIQRKLATMEDAQGEHEKIKAINSAASELSDKSVAYYYIKALEEMSRGSSSKIIFPMEFTKLANILTGKIEANPKEQSQAEDFLKKYGSVIDKYLEKQKDEK